MNNSTGPNDSENRFPLRAQRTLLKRPAISRHARRRGLLIGTALAGIAVVTSAGAQEWTGQTSSDYTDGSNWAGGAPPNSTIAPVVFGASGNTTVNLATPQPAGYYFAGSVTFNDPASAYTVNVSNQAYLNISGGVNNTSGVTQNFSVTGTGGYASEIIFSNSNAGSNVVYTANADGTIQFNSAGGSASGADASFVLNGGGIALSGSGTLALGSVEGTGILAYNGNPNGSAGTIEIGGLNTSTTLDAQIQEQTGTLSITKVGSGTLTLTGASDYTGGTFLKAGALSLDNNAALGSGSVSANGGTTIDIQDGITITNALTMYGSVILNVSSGTGTYAGEISDFEFAGIIKTGAGTLVLDSISNTSFNSFSGGATISDGILRIMNSNSLGATGSGQVTLDGGTLQAGADNLVISNSQIAFGASGGAIDTQGFNLSTGANMIDAEVQHGTFKKLGTGTLTITGYADSNTYSTATDVAEGTLKAGDENIFSKNSAYTIENGATLSLGNFDQAIGSLAGAGSVDAGTATLTTGNDKVQRCFPVTSPGPVG
ncbi:autotransporter-associated beta strand repeat-containing protein [Mesorhizobium sp. PAMC28654]|uniref:autotransporter-associated beta strand repeat-containing protein n=1 Tax=Mesorhizobium sp. PAMC28654 TaxID=2880934 RepID=UPI001D0A3507|nr:autotransporter-associated beta strand repeat-containing protein [Mesorhizobium sp. PAMC28654]UDL89714.1 autotransporter-associated beta strand repeat-containing protein [Mesorhizobium sp. PAMC28654]